MLYNENNKKEQGIPRCKSCLHSSPINEGGEVWCHKLECYMGAEDFTCACFAPDGIQDHSLSLCASCEFSTVLNNNASVLCAHPLVQAVQYSPRYSCVHYSNKDGGGVPMSPYVPGSPNYDPNARCNNCRYFEVPNFLGDGWCAKTKDYVNQTDMICPKYVKQTKTI